MIGVQILYHLVTEMNLAESMRSLTKHRKVASSFRDESLYDIFTLSCTLLQQINVHDKTQVATFDACRESAGRESSQTVPLENLFGLVNIPVPGFYLGK